MTDKTLAAVGETYMATEARRQGWSILARNFRHIGFELDIVAWKAGTLIAMEVKSRSGSRLPEIASLISRRKLAALRRGLLTFAHRKGLSPTTLRIDLAVVLFSGDKVKSPDRLAYFAAVQNLYGDL